MRGTGQRELRSGTSWVSFLFDSPSAARREVLEQHGNFVRINQTPPGRMLQKVSQRPSPLQKNVVDAIFVQDLKGFFDVHGRLVVIQCPVVDEYVSSPVNKGLQLRDVPFHVAAELYRVEDSALEVVLSHEVERCRWIFPVQLPLEAGCRGEEIDHGGD